LTDSLHQKKKKEFINPSEMKHFFRIQKRYKYKYIPWVSACEGITASDREKTSRNQTNAIEISGG